ATAQRNKARAELKSLELEVTAAVWKAYYDFFSARKKYAAAEALVACNSDIGMGFMYHEACLKGSYA
ncbi:MAG: hypothetical protein WA177_21440, partial [Xanthobacteraceae bacterium]